MLLNYSPRYSAERPHASVPLLSSKAAAGLDPCRGRHMLLWDPITLFFSSVSSFHRKMEWTLFPKLGGITGNSELLTTKEWQRYNKDMRSWTRKLPAVGSVGIRRARGYLFLDAILNNRSPIQSQETFLRQVPHQADDGLLTALCGHAFLLLLIHDHFLNPEASQNKQLTSPTSTQKAVLNPGNRDMPNGTQQKLGEN